MILEYLMKYHFQDCINILAEPDNLGYYSIKIDFLKLFETYPDVGDKVLCSPIESLPICNNNIKKAQQNILESDKSIISKLDYHYLKRNVHARFYGLPVCPELHRTVFPNNVDLGCFLKVTGTIVRVTQSKMLEYQRKYVCAKCKFENTIEAEFENRYILRAPSRCSNEDTRCKSSTFTQVHLVSREHCKDYQEIKIQEQVNKLSIGTIPGSMWVVLENDLVDSCKPGDDVNICGIVRRRWRPCTQNKKSEVELVLQANYLEVCNAQRAEVIATAPDVKDCFNDFWTNYEACPLKGRDKILASVCPQVYGLHLVKLAVLLTVITGSDHNSDDVVDKKTSQDDTHKTRVRGQCHLLLVGDPGTGKSQLLKSGAELSTRSVFTSGAGSTRAGLTCAALREEGEWQLEAGALVLSDGGVCCIDEIGQLREHDRTAIHEAMEQQTISIAKAGIVCKLNTRCAVIAACNPKGHYITDQPLSTNVSLGTPLLSRFDLIFILLDSKNKVWDQLVSSYILFGGSTAEVKKQWSLEKIQMYIGLVGPRCTEMTKSANIILQSYYMMQRKSEHRDPSRTTVRMLDSLVRLSQAHCRLMYRTTILPVDAIVAISLIDLSMQDCTLNDTVDALHSTFPKYPDFEYMCLAKKILSRLNLYEIWQNELLYYAKLLQVDHKSLQVDVDNGNNNLFSKYDDVTDDNIQLSSSLITSSYFNGKKQNLCSQDINNIQKGNVKGIDKQVNVVTDKLAATLKKHAALNKEDKKPPIKVKKPYKRKRKEGNSTGDKQDKKAKRNTKEPKTIKEDDISYSDTEMNSSKEMLNAVPSVNDFFNDLGIDFKFTEEDNSIDTDIIRTSTQIEVKPSTSKESGKENHGDLNKTKNNNMLNQFQYKSRNDSLKKTPIKDNTNIKTDIDAESSNSSNKEKERLNLVEENISKDKLNNSITNKLKYEGSNDLTTKDRCKQNQDVKENIPNDKLNNSITNKLKQFQYEGTNDLSKYEDKAHKSIIVETVSLGTNKQNSSNSNKSLQSSQISMFESSDCDIDLEI